ncbi:hypothetical protein, partial [Escherichia coli]|uniref:hypothetical protein n=1 Tax=Escherichia coli TaxID=562 RepID=UPI002018FD4B
LPSETMIWQPEFTDKTLSRKPGAVHRIGGLRIMVIMVLSLFVWLGTVPEHTGHMMAGEAPVVVSNVLNR